MRRKGTTTLRLGDRPIASSGILELAWPYSIAVRTSFGLIGHPCSGSGQDCYSNGIPVNTNVDLLRFQSNDHAIRFKRR
jgi:hypothetical protein